MPSNLQVPVVAEVIEYLPAKLAFHFLYELLHEEFKRLEVNALDCFGLIVIFVDYYLLESGNMSLLEVLIKHFFLQVDQILVIHDAITVCIANAEYSQESFLVVWFQALFDGVVQWSYWVEDCTLSRSNDVYQVERYLGRAFQSHLDLLELLIVVVE